MSSVSRYYPSNTPQNMSQTNLSLLSTYTVTNGDAQLYFASPTSYISDVDAVTITLPSQSTANWNNYPIIYMTNMSQSNHALMRFNFAAGVKVKAPDMDNYTSTFAIRGGFSGYIIYTGNNQWMLQGVGANFDGA